MRIGYYKIRDSSLHRLPDYVFMGLTIVHLMIYNSSKVSPLGLHLTAPLISLLFSRFANLDAQLTSTLETETFSFIKQSTGGRPHCGPPTLEGVGPPQPRAEQHHRPPRRGLHGAQPGQQAVAVRQ